jgi:hypothetical protein
VDIHIRIVGPDRESHPSIGGSGRGCLWNVRKENKRYDEK